MGMHSYALFDTQGNFVMVITVTYTSFIRQVQIKDRSQKSHGKIIEHVE